LPPLAWWLRDPVTRASFLLTATYLIRDRDAKLRVYPGLAPFLIMPALMLLQGNDKFMRSFGLAFMVAFLCSIPLMAQSLIQYSQQWQAADLFRMAPLAGPARLCHGVRRAVAVFVVLPMLLITVLIMALLPGEPSRWLLLLPGLIALPVCARLPTEHGWAPPFSQPVQEAKSASRGLWGFLAMMVSMGLAGSALVAQHFGVLGWFLLVEALVATCVYGLLRARLERAVWPETAEG
jgi:hypothetical protein